MNCGEQIPDDKYISYDCVKEIGHPGAHESSSGRRLPRPVPSGDAEEALALIDRAAGPRRWDLNEREFYVKFSVTNVYMIKVTAESEDAALNQYSDYCDLPDFHRESPIDGDVEIERPDKHDRLMLTGAPIGPKIACPDCGALAMSRGWYHKPLRKCHGPIEWVETRSRSPRHQWRRKFPDAPSLPAVAMAGGA